MSNKNLSNQSFFEYIFNYFKNNLNDINENIANLIFYYIFCSNSLEKLNILEFDLSKFSDSLNSLKNNTNQINLLKIILENNLSAIKSFDYNAFENNFGCEFENIQKNAYIRVLANVMGKLTTNSNEGII